MKRHALADRHGVDSTVCGVTGDELTMLYWRHLPGDDRQMLLWRNAPRQNFWLIANEWDGQAVTCKRCLRRIEKAAAG